MGCMPRSSIDVEFLAQAVKAQGPLEAPASVAAAADTGQSLLYHMRGNARANAADLLHNWLQDFQASGVRHTPQSLTSLVQVQPAQHWPLFINFKTSLPDACYYLLMNPS